MDIKLIIAAGLAMFYANFVIHESYIFEAFRFQINNFINKAFVSGKFYGSFLKKLWGCLLCQNFWIGLVLAAALDNQFYLAVTAPVVAQIITIWIRKNS